MCQLLSNYFCIIVLFLRAEIIVFISYTLGLLDALKQIFPLLNVFVVDNYPENTPPAKCCGQIILSMLPHFIQLDTNILQCGMSTKQSRATN